MSQNPHPQPDFSDFLPSRERRVPSPITNLPVNALTDDLDPTREIRSLIEQLQQASRDARAQTLRAEQEKGDLASQLETALVQVEQLRAKERESRAQFVEITSLIRERDTAIEESEKQRLSSVEAQRKLEAAARERNDAQRQREELSRRHADAAKAAQDALAQLGEAQKQIINIRQARDAATGQNLELSNKFARAEDDIAELEYQRDAAQKAQKHSQEELSDFRRQLATVTADRDATASQVKDLSNQIDEARRKLLDLSEQKSAVLESDSQHLAALAEARQQVVDITSERDAARLRNHDLTHEIDALQTQLAELREQQMVAGVAPEELDELHRQMTGLMAERDRHETLEHQLAAETAAQQERLAQLAEQLAAAERGREDALAAAEVVHYELERVLAERAQQPPPDLAEAEAKEAQFAALRTQVRELECDLMEAHRRLEELSSAQEEARLVASRFEKQRLATIDLGARLELAQREIVELSANLAEARLAARFANSRAAKEAASALKQQVSNFASSFDLTQEAGSDSFDPGAGQYAAQQLPEMSETLDEKSAKSALGAMRHCFQSFQKTPGDLSLLNELYSHAYSFSERARVSGYLALYRLSSSFASLVHGLYETPETLNQSTLRTVSQTIEFLITLMKDRQVAQIPDPSRGQVYIVDDDADNCQAISFGMETSGLRSVSAQEPAIALAELSSGNFDLIILDVNLPGMDGFELCAHIRQLPTHAKTPIVFLTGLATLENRVQSSLSGGSDFVGKPFNLHELTVKALSLILRTQLMMD